MRFAEVVAIEARSPGISEPKLAFPGMKTSRSSESANRFEEREMLLQPTPGQSIEGFVSARGWFLRDRRLWNATSAEWLGNCLELIGVIAGQDGVNAAKLLRACGGCLGARRR